MADSKNSKSSFWSFLIYPEWFEGKDSKFFYNLVSSYQIPGFISPLHDMDKTAEGELKKAHYHVYLKWSGPTTFNNALTTVQEIIPEVKYIMPMASIPGSWDYARHVENDDKYHYDVNDRLIFNGFDIDREVKFNLADEEKYKMEIQEFCFKKGCFEIAHLNYYAMLNNPEWYKVINANIYFFNSILTSWRNGGTNIDYLYD